MKPQSAKAKGRKAAKEVKGLIMQLFPELTADDVIVASSGQTGEDIILSARARGLLPISIECKNVERLNIWDALAQAESNAKEWQPLLAIRRNNSKLYGVMDLTQIMALLRLHAAWQMSQEPHEGLKNGN